MIRRQEIYCHNCDNYVQFDIDMGLNGNHVLECPKCGHEHCRVVVDGEITGDRWDSRNGNTYTVSTATMSYSSNSTWVVYAQNSSSINYTVTYSAPAYLYDSWMNHS
jgi:hypothetical protein